MSSGAFSNYWKSRKFSEFQCYVIFLALKSPVIFIILQTAAEYRTCFHLLLFATGFATFTFLEYIAHRFWMHDEDMKHFVSYHDHHWNHHGYSKALMMTPGFRSGLIAINALVIVPATLLDNYFTFFAGFYTGFVYYCFVHVFLHTTFAKKIFPRLQISHMYHHCKFPDRCFSTCLTYWDDLFNTGVPEEVSIPDRLIQRYFAKTKSVKRTDSSTFAALLKKQSNEHTTFVRTGTAAPRKAGGIDHDGYRALPGPVIPG